MRNTIELVTVQDINNAISPILKELEELKSYLNSQPPKQYYRNKDLKKIFGLSDNTIKEYRDTNVIPYTWIGCLPLYPIADFNIMLMRNSNYDLIKKVA